MICTRRKGAGRTCSWPRLPGDSYCVHHRAERYFKKSEHVQEELAAVEAICWLCVDRSPWLSPEGDDAYDPWQ